MSSIKAFFGCTYHGTADGDCGVFTRPETGSAFAGSHANGCARVGVNTKTSGRTEFVECDADGKSDGRALACDADGDTWYYLFEHGESKEEAVLRADGTCGYNGEDCRADFPPFVQLQAKVLPIKARPQSPQPPRSRIRPHPPRPHRLPIHPSAMFWHSQELASTHADKVRTCRLLRPARPARRNPHRLQKKSAARSTWTTHRAEGCTTRVARPHT